MTCIYKRSNLIGYSAWVAETPIGTYDRLFWNLNHKYRKTFNIGYTLEGNEIDLMVPVYGCMDLFIYLLQYSAHLGYMEVLLACEMSIFVLPDEVLQRNPLQSAGHCGNIQDKCISHRIL